MLNSKIITSIKMDYFFIKNGGKEISSSFPLVSGFTLRSNKSRSNQPRDTEQLRFFIIGITKLSILSV